MEEILKVSNLNKSGILHDISFSLKKGEMVAVMGPSGSGKSTLLYNVSGMDQADSGEVFLGDKEIVGLSEDDKATLRLESMGFVFQNMNMLSNLTIKDNICFPAVHAAGGKKRKDEISLEADKLMEKLGVSGLPDRYITQVSGGQLQRACICRSMINHPMILLADEPTGALNQSSTKEVMEAFTMLNKEGTTELIVTHDSRVATCCDRILYLVDGQIRGELVIGKYDEENEKERDENVTKWLSQMGW